MPITAAQRNHIFPRWEIKDVLHERGFDWRRYTNPAAVVQNAVKGMLKRGEITMTVLADGTKTYAWAPKKKRRGAVQTRE